MKYSAFSYKKGNSFLHRCPAWVKILCIPLMNILFLCLPPFFSIVLVVLQFILALALSFSIREQLTDLKPVLYYAFIVFFMQLMMWFFSGMKDFTTVFSWENQSETVFMLIKILAVMQSASLVYKTSTSLELRDGIARIFGHKSMVTNAMFLFLNFIPMVSKIWEQSEKAWYARGGKKSMRMYMTLLPVLFSVGMKKAWNAARALAVRK